MELNSIIPGISGEKLSAKNIRAVIFAAGLCFLVFRLSLPCNNGGDNTVGVLNPVICGIGKMSADTDSGLKYASKFAALVAKHEIIFILCLISLTAAGWCRRVDLLGFASFHNKAPPIHPKTTFQSPLCI